MTGLEALRRLAPRRHRMTPARCLTLAAAMWMIHRIHHDAAHMWLTTEPAAPTRLAERNVFMIQVPDLADRRHALDVNLANLARGHLDRRILAFTGDELNRRPGAARDLPALARAQLHVVDLRAQRDVLEGQAVARQDVNAVAGDDRIADFDARWLQDVPLLAVRIGDKRDPRRAVRVVLDRRHLARDVFLVPLEVDDAIEPLVPAATPPGGQVTLIVATSRTIQLLGQRTVRLARRNLVERLHRLEP